MCSVLSLALLKESKMGTFEKIFGTFTCYLLSLGATCYMLSGFCNPHLISIHVITQVSLLLSFSKYIHFRQYYKFPLIVRDLRHIYISASYVNCEQSLIQEL